MALRKQDGASVHVFFLLFLLRCSSSVHCPLFFQQSDVQNSSLPHLARVGGPFHPEGRESTWPWHQQGAARTLGAPHTTNWPCPSKAHFIQELDFLSSLLDQSSHSSSQFGIQAHLTDSQRQAASSTGVSWGEGSVSQAAYLGDCVDLDASLNLTPNILFFTAI